MRIRALALTVSFLGAFGCALMTPLDDLGPRAADGGTGLDGSTSDGTTTSDGGSVDAPPPVPDVPLPATCKSGNVRCVAEPPSGWSAPFALYAGAPSGAPTCPTDAPLAALDAYAGLNGVSPAVCGACSCVASKIGCAKVTGTAYQGTACTGSCNSFNTTVDLTDGTCANFDCTNGNEGSIYVPLPTVSATCTPAAPKPSVTLPPVSWSTRALGCRAPNVQRVDCAAGEVCATKAPAPFATTMCISQAGNVACPSGPYSVKKGPYAQGTSDTRDCSACGCGSASGNCTATVTPYTAPVVQCISATAAPVNLPGCVARGTADRYLMKATPPGQVACPATGGTPTGTVVSSSLVTVCCEP
jgi:hypothetical protein